MLSGETPAKRCSMTVLPAMTISVMSVFFMLLRSASVPRLLSISSVRTLWIFASASGDADE